MDYRPVFEEMCYYFLSLMEGDTHNIESAFVLMRAHGIVDEDGERINEDE